MEHLSRSMLREKVMTILYQVNVFESNKIDYKLTDLIKENVDIDNEYINDTVHGILKNINDIDKLANSNLKDWDIKRLGKTVQAILEMVINEFKYTDTPPVICINEAVELAKKYSDDKVTGMINSVLDKIYHSD